MHKVLKWLMTAIYFSTVIFVVFFLPRRQELVWTWELINLIPVWNTAVWFHAIEIHPELHWKDFLANLFGNILLFVPFPVFTAELFTLTNKKIILLTGAVVSMLIEFIQGIFRIGVPDIDDVLLNTTGVIVGNYLWLVLKKKNIKIPFEKHAERL